MSNLRRHDTLRDLSQQDDLGSPDGRHDDIVLSAQPTDIDDPTNFMRSETISNTIPSLVWNPTLRIFLKLWSGLPQVHRHIMPYGPTIGSLLGHSRVGVPSPSYHAVYQADGSPSPSSNSGGGSSRRQGKRCSPGGRGYWCQQFAPSWGCYSYTLTTREKQIQSFPRYYH